MAVIETHVRLVNWHHTEVVRIPNHIIEQLKLVDNQMLTVTIQGESIVLTPVR